MKIISIIKTNTVPHSVNDSKSKGLVNIFFQNSDHVLPQSLNIYSDIIAVVIQYDCI